MQDTATTADAIRGRDLKHLRIERRVSAAAVGRAAGWSRSRVSAIEATDMPPSPTVQRYLAGLLEAASQR